jgi:hypothetical protein
MVASAILSVDNAIIGAKMFGRMWRRDTNFEIQKFFLL